MTSKIQEGSLKIEGLISALYLYWMLAVLPGGALF